MLLLRDLILLITVFNAVASLLILLHWPCRIWPMPAWSSHGSAKPDVKASEKGEHANEKTVD